MAGRARESRYAGRGAAWAGSPGTWAAAAALTGFASLLILRTTVMEGVWFWDTAEAQTVPPLLGTMHPTGFPAYVLLGWFASLVLTPFGDPAFRMNLLSAILVSAAAGGTVLVARRLRVPLAVAAAAGLGLAVTPIAWEIGSSADVHALHLLLVVLLVLVLLEWERRVRADDREMPALGRPRHADRWLVASAGVFGVLLANHALTFLLAPAVGLYVLAVDPGVLARPRVVLASLGALVGVAALLYLELPLRAGPFRAPIVYADPSTWAGFWYVALAEQFRGSIVDPLGNLGGKLASLAELTAAQLGVLAWLVPPAWVVTAVRHPRYALLSGSAVAITVFFAASYENAEIDRYYLGPAFFAWTWLAVLAAATVAVLTRPRLLRRGLPAALIVGGVALTLLVPSGLALPDRRDDVLAAQRPDARPWLDAAMARLAPDALILSSWSFSTTLWYGQLIEGRRPDIRVVDDRDLLDEHLGDVSDVIDANLGRRPVYVVRISPVDVVELQRRYRLEALGEPSGVFRVLGRVEDAA